jgi:hypothetical protein
MTITAHAELMTKVQKACREAKTSRRPTDLETARQLMETAEVKALPKELYENLRWAYADAVIGSTGAMAP